MDPNAARDHLHPLFDGGCNWLTWNKQDLLNRAMEAMHALRGASVETDPHEQD